MNRFKYLHKYIRPQTLSYPLQVGDRVKTDDKIWGHQSMYGTIVKRRINKSLRGIEYHGFEVKWDGGATSFWLEKDLSHE